MSLNYYKLDKIVKFVALPIWVLVGLFASRITIMLLYWLLTALKIPIDSINPTIFNTLATAAVYVVALFIVIVLPRYTGKRRISLADVGLGELPSWTSILIAPAGLIIYFILSAIIISVATKFLPWFNVDQVQDVGFDNISRQFEYILAFISLVVVAPIAEETLFRGYLYGKLRERSSVILAVITTSVLFGFVHGAWNLAFDTFALSIVLCLLREYTGDLWASILLHMLKNGIAYYCLFINPAILTTLVR